MFKVYKRKIQVWVISYPQGTKEVTYAYSSYAYKTCKDAVKAASINYPGLSFIASFDKD